MATTVGETVSSAEMVVAQFDDVAEGTTVESLVIKFDQAKYEKYLSSPSSSGEASRRCRGVVHVARPQAVKAAMLKNSTRANTGGSVPPEAVEAGQKTKHRCEVPNSGEPRQSGEPTNSGGLRSISQVANSGELRESGELSDTGEVYNLDELHKSGEPTYSGGLHCISQVANSGELRESGELSDTGEVPNADELRKSGELCSSGGLHSNSKVPHSGELSRTGEPPKSGGVRSSSYLAGNCCTGEAYQPRLKRQMARAGQLAEARLNEKPSPAGPRLTVQLRRTRPTGEPRQAEPRLTAQLRPQTNLRQKGKASARRTGALHQARPMGEPHQAEPHQRTRMGVAFLSGYTRSVPTSDDGDGYCSAVATSQTSSSIQGRSVEVHMADASDEISRRFDEQQATINSMKEMLEQLLSEKKKKRRRTSRSLRKYPKHKERVPTSDSSSESSGGASSSGHNPRFDELQSQLDALKLQQSMNEPGVVRPYPIEWDMVSYPTKFEPLDLLQFDGKGSPSQHIYYFQAQTGHVVGNDPIMTRLFIGTLKGVAFEWFRRLEPGSITCWKDMERLFMARFFDDDTEVSMATLLATKQRNTESVGNFVKRFRNRSLRTRDQCSEATLIEMCRNNLSIDILSNMGAVESRSWKDLIRQGEQVESMLKRIDAEELHDFREDDDQDDFILHTPTST